MSGYTPGAGLPLDLPLGSPDRVLDPNVHAMLVSPTETNTPVSSTPELAASDPVKRRRRVDADVLAVIDQTMPDRDREVLERVGDHRYLTTHQIQRFAFTNHATDDSAARSTRYVVQRLERLALLRPLTRRIGGVRAGSAARVWQLAPAGSRLLRSDGSTFRTHEPSPRFLGHCLAVADVHLGLRDLAMLDHVRRVDVQTEPDCWRRYTGSGGEPRWLQPDLAAKISTADYDDRWYIEVDLGTESLPVVLRKCGQYEAYRSSGIDQAEYGAFPLVLWLFTNPERAERVRSAIARSPRLTPQLYRIATPDSFAALMRESLS